MPLFPQASVGTAGNILLIEEYDALAAAFGSALRRLAPDKETIVARSFAEAEKVADRIHPDLFVIDFDPPPHRAIAFLNRLKSQHPEARVLIIAASQWPELARQRHRPGGLHFIEKPFELAKFDVALKTLLPTEETAAASVNIGALRDLDLTDMIALFGSIGANTVLKVTATSGSIGEIYFAGGQLTSATAGSKTGSSGLEEMLRWKSPRFAEMASRDERPRTMRGRWTTILSAALRATRPIEEAAPSSAAFVAPAPPEKKVVVIDDTELLLVFVEDVLRTARPSLKIFTASNGFEGLRRTAENLPDLVLLDYSLPDIAGGEVCRLLLEDALTARIPVIMMSGHVAEMASTAAKYPNVIASIAKPFVSSALVSLVEQTLSDLEQPASAKRKRAARSSKRIAPKTVSPGSETESANANPSDPSAPPVPDNGSFTPAAPVDPAVPATIDPEQAERPPPETPPPESPASLPEPIDSPPTFEPPPEKLPEIPPNESAPNEPTLPAADLPNETSQAPKEPATAARIPRAKGNTVVLAMPLEITSIQFSSTLQVRAIRAKPNSSIVSVHILPAGVSPEEVVAKNFELEHVDLDTRGQIRAVHLAPAAASAGEPVGGRTLAVAELAAFSEGEETMQLLAEPGASMPIHLLTLFELVSVELAEGFSIGRLRLQTRNAKVRVKLVRENLRTGLTFQSAQVLLNRSAQIADVLLDALA
ncbi:MAG: response regulator [Chthoniobacterales bacterium]